MTHQNNLLAGCIIEIEQHGAFQVATAPGAVSGFIAWGKRGKITTDSPFKEPGDPVWIGTGETRAKAKAVVMRDIEEQRVDSGIASLARQVKVQGVLTGVLAVACVVLLLIALLT